MGRGAGGGSQINLNVNAGASSTHHRALEGVEFLGKFWDILTKRRAAFGPNVTRTKKEKKTFLLQLLRQNKTCVTARGMPVSVRARWNIPPN